MNFHQNYQKAVQPYRPRANYFTNSLRAFIVGGLICTVGQVLQNILIYFYSLSEIMSQLFVSGILIVITALLTGMGVYGKIGRFAGGGAFVPITGFANSFTSAALEHRSEGIVWGVCNQMFKVAGVVIVCGVISAYLLGAIYYIGF